MQFKFVTAALLAVLACSEKSSAQSPNTVSLNYADFTASAGAEKSWAQAADVTPSFANAGNVKTEAGSGVIVYTGKGSVATFLSRSEYKDAEIEFDFLLDKGTTFGVMLQGRYRISLSDSWQSSNPSFNDMGGIGPRKQDAGAFSSIAPAMNVAKAPGLWQHARIKFRAPVFNGSNKTANGLFEEVYINGVLVQQNAEVQAPFAGSIADNEVSNGPLMFIAGNGTVALKNLKLTKLEPLAPVVVATGRRMRRVANPIILNPEGKNYVLRSFLNFNGKKRTHVVSLGSTAQVNYSYDVKQGALLQVWHGAFMDVTEMWEQRGEPQLAAPLGNLVPLSDAPALTKLVAENSVWPDSLKFDDLKNLGYTLDKQRNPTFEYETGANHVTDKIAPATDGRSLQRELTVTGNTQNLYCRVTAATAVKSLGKGLYLIGDKEYYVQLDESIKPHIRFMQGKQELLIPVKENSKLTYSIIW